MKTYTTNHNIPITFSESEIKPKIELSKNLEKVILFLKDKISKFSDISNWLAKDGQYNYLIVENRPNYSFLDLTDDERFNLHFELLKIKQCLNPIFNSPLLEFLQTKDKEWRKTFMPKINLIITGSRSCPPISEIIDIIGEEEFELRIDKGLAYIDTLMYPTIR